MSSSLIFHVTILCYIYKKFGNVRLTSHGGIAGGADAAVSNQDARHNNNQISISHSTRSLHNYQ